jgi:hypothetical protein
MPFRAACLLRRQFDTKCSRSLSAVAALAPKRVGFLMAASAAKEEDLVLARILFADNAAIGRALLLRGVLGFHTRAYCIGYAML